MRHGNCALPRCINMLEKRIVNGGAAIVELPKEVQTRILLFVRSVSSYQKTSRGPRGDETLWVSIEADSFVARGDAFETRMARLQSGVARLDVATQAAGDYRKEKLPIHLDLDAVLDSIRLGNGSLFGRLTTEYVAVKVDRDGIVLAFRTALRPPLTRERPYGIGVPGPPLPSTLGAVQALVTDALSDTPRCSKHVSTRGTDGAYLRLLDSLSREHVDAAARVQTAALAQERRLADFHAVAVAEDRPLVGTTAIIYETNVVDGVGSAGAFVYPQQERALLVERLVELGADVISTSPRPQYLKWLSSIGAKNFRGAGRVLAFAPGPPGGWPSSTSYVGRGEGVRLACEQLANASVVYDCGGVAALHSAFFGEERWPLAEAPASFDDRFQIYQPNEAYAAALARGMKEKACARKGILRVVLNPRYATAAVAAPPRTRRVAPSRTGKAVVAADFAQPDPSRLATSMMKAHRDEAHFQALVADYARASVLLDDLREKLTAAGPTGKVSLKNYLTDKEQVALRTVLGARNPSGALRGKVEALVDKLEPHVELLRQRAASR